MAKLACKIVPSIRFVLMLGFLVACMGYRYVSAADSNEPAESDAWLKAAKEKVEKLLPNFSYEAIELSELPGIVEIHGPGSILYFAPDQDILVMGELWRTSGTSITQEKVTLATAAKATDIDLTSSITVGEGSRELIAFVNPDCGYCKKAQEWFAARDLTHVQTHYFLMPTPGRADSKQRALNAICAPDKQRAAAMSHLYERGPVETVAECEDGEAQLAKHAEIARKVGVNATPFFLVKDPTEPRYEVIAGFAPEKLEPLLLTKTGGNRQ